MRSRQPVVTALTERIKEAAQGGLTGHRFNAQDLRDGRVTLPPRHARELVRAAQNAAHITRRHVGRIIGMGTGGGGRQDGAQLVAEAFLMQEMRPDDEAAVGGEALVGEADTDGRRGRFGVKVQAHRLVRLRLRRSRQSFLHKSKLAKRRSLFQLHRSG